jgi:flagellin-like protein
MRGWVQDTRGVSPVIGVVMMVAVAVLLAGVVAAYVFGIGNGELEMICNLDIASLFGPAC